MWTGAAIEVERFLMNDMDHRVIGGRLAESWGIDTELQQVITHHHDVGENAPGLLKLIAFADMAASCLFPYPAGTLSTPSPSSSRASTKR